MTSCAITIRIECMLPVHVQPHHRPPTRCDRSCNIRMRKLGALQVSELGFGTLSFASTYGQAPEKAESIRVISGAHDLGVTLFDTAEVHGPWTNEALVGEALVGEALVGEALAPVRDEVVIATKFGFD